VYGSVASYCEHSAEPLGSTNLIQISWLSATISL
jgi:hypothetical protein